MRILLVDDSKTMRRIFIRALFSLKMFDIIEASSGAEALQLLERGVDLVITDFNMSNMNGIELTRAIRARADHCQLPILMITAQEFDDSLLAQAKEAGTDEFVSKNLTSEALMAQINKVIASRAKSSLRQ